MTTGEQLVIYSTLSTGTALDHFLNISTGSGIEYVYIPAEEAVGTIEQEILVEGNITIQELVLGKIDETITISGFIEDDDVSGEIESDNEIKGDKPC